MGCAIARAGLLQRTPSMADRRGRSGRPFERIKARIKAEATHCCKCGQPLNPDLEWPHPWSTSIEHLVPLHHGGDPLDPDNLDAAHLHCNVKDGNRIRLGTREPKSFRDDNW